MWILPHITDPPGCTKAHKLAIKAFLVRSPQTSWILGTTHHWLFKTRSLAVTWIIMACKMYQGCLVHNHQSMWGVLWRCACVLAPQVTYRNKPVKIDAFWLLALTHNKDDSYCCGQGDTHTSGMSHELLLLSNPWNIKMVVMLPLYLHNLVEPTSMIVQVCHWWTV